MDKLSSLIAHANMENTKYKTINVTKLTHLALKTAAAALGYKMQDAADEAIQIWLKNHNFVLPPNKSGKKA